MKKIINKYAVRVGYFVGVNTQFTNAMYYKWKVAKKYKHYDKILEIKKEYIFEKDYKSKCLTIYAIQSKQEIIDKELQDFYLGNSFQFKYIFFCNSILDMRLGALHINNIANVPVKFE